MTQATMRAALPSALIYPGSASFRVKAPLKAAGPVSSDAGF